MAGTTLPLQRAHQRQSAPSVRGTTAIRNDQTTSVII
jgi:hypothetical protein